MSKHTVRKGNVFIGYIHAGIDILGDEVIVETAFPESDPDGDNQCSSFEQGEQRLLGIYEDHLVALQSAPARLPAADAAEPQACDDSDDLPF